MQELDRINKNIQEVENNLQELSSEVFQSFNRKDELSNIIISIGHNSDLALKIHYHLKHFGVEIGFLESEVESSEDFIELSLNNKRYSIYFKKINSVINSLRSHCSLLEDKCSLLLDATLGLINIQQNNIIKILKEN